MRVDLVVVSFSVRFGSDSAGAQTKPLVWNDFTALLPDPKTVCRIAITDGLFKTQDAPANSSGKLWIVRAKQVAFQTRSVIPASELVYADTTVQQSSTAPDGIAIKPMNLTGVGSQHTLAIYQGNSTTPIDVSDWSLDPLPQTVPASLWSAPPEPFSQIPAKPSADVLRRRAVRLLGHRAVAGGRRQPRPGIGAAADGGVPLAARAGAAVRRCAAQPETTCRRRTRRPSACSGR